MESPRNPLPRPLPLIQREALQNGQLGEGGSGAIQCNTLRVAALKGEDGGAEEQKNGGVEMLYRKVPAFLCSISALRQNSGDANCRYLIRPGLLSKSYRNGERARTGSE